MEKVYELCMSDGQASLCQFYTFTCLNAGKRAKKLMNSLKTAQPGRGKAWPLAVCRVHSHASQHKAVSHVSIPATLPPTWVQFAGPRPEGVARKLQKEAKRSRCRTPTGLPVGPVQYTI